MNTPEDAPSHGDGVLWGGASTARWPGLLAGGMAIFAILVVVRIPQAGPGALAILAAAALVAPLGRIEVVVVEAGLQVFYGRSGLVRQRFALSRLDSASTTHLSAWSGGGLGYKGSLRLIGWARAANRAGPGLCVRLDGRRTFTVSVAGPGGAVEALVGLGVRRGGVGG